MDADELPRRFPRLYHMAADGSWPSISSNGLLSATALLDLFEVTGPEREPIEAARRPEGVTLDHPVHGRAVIRDNKPLIESRLRTCLRDGLTPQDWYRLLNRKVFFWPTKQRVETLLGAAAYHADPQLVLTVHTGPLVAAHRDSIMVSPINSGATRPFAWPRGATTFQSIEEYDFDEARRRRGPQKAIAELTVDYALPDVLELVESVVRHLPNGESEVLWHVDT